MNKVKNLLSIMQYISIVLFSKLKLLVNFGSLVIQVQIRNFWLQLGFKPEALSSSDLTFALIRACTSWYYNEIAIPVYTQQGLGRETSYKYVGMSFSISWDEFDKFVSTYDITPNTSEWIWPSNGSDCTHLLEHCKNLKLLWRNQNI